MLTEEELNELERLGKEVHRLMRIEDRLFDKGIAVDVGPEYWKHTKFGGTCYDLFFRFSLDTDYLITVVTDDSSLDLAQFMQPGLDEVDDEDEAKVPANLYYKCDEMRGDNLTKDAYFIKFALRSALRQFYKQRAGVPEYM